MRCGFVLLILLSIARPPLPARDHLNTALQTLF